ncbi:Increased rDNA silencing protein [Neonectria punicea]|uniref:Increased rDNA silencing protein n=1 Tax=Neonectria punicea TaxID=979145 RepID=A0ABR1HE73_9HYPO
MNPIASHISGPPDPATTALQGASLAFRKKKPAPPPDKKDNGALTAATSAGRPRSPVKHLRAQSTGGSTMTVDSDPYGGGGIAAARMHQFGASTSQLHPGYAKPDPKSASFIAATLAASRSASPTPKTTTPRRRTSVGAVSFSSSGEVVDSGSIPPTGSLISMFEQVRTGDPVKRSSPKRSPARSAAGSNDSIAELPEPPPVTAPALKPKPKPKPKLTPKPRSLTPPPQPVTQSITKSIPELLSPKPKVKSKPRPLTPPPQPVTQSITKSIPEVLSPKPKPKTKPRPLTPPQPATRSAPEVLSPKPRRPSKPALKPVLRSATPPQIITRAPTQVLLPPSPDPRKRSPKPRQQPPTPPQPRGSKKPVSKSNQVHTVTSRQSTPNLVGPRTPAPVGGRLKRSETVSSDDTFVSASSVQSPERLSPLPLPDQREPATSMPPSPSRDIRRQRPKNSSVTSLPLESLTDAIMASSLASARLTPHNTGGSLSAPPLPRRQKSPRLMQTLRQPAKESDEEVDRYKKGHLRKLHGGKKHSHHEGSRRRWREEITPRERKRYEAVWASNRGVLLDQHNSRAEPTEYVLNLVVREIWKRSRLPVDELAEVWDLVDRQGRGMLGRQEFVVGMWLIDQRLRGRKIPAKVSDSVWGSANGMQVVKPKLK